MNVLTILPSADVGSSVFSLITDAGLFAKAILLILFAISIISWAIIWDRTRLYLLLRKKGLRLRDSVSKGGLLSAMDGVKDYLPSVEGSILLETQRYLGSTYKETGRAGGGSGELPEIIPVRAFLERQAMNEISEMEKYLIFLSTTSAVAPFLGLLGTVWGIMSSFLSMGVQGTASIEVVGPGIAEALVTTIAGLATAIPALVGYNILVRYVHRQETRTDLFISRVAEQVSHVERQQSKTKVGTGYEKESL
ncbi:MAG: MotA/TolQ/ExbB proton channel family protein [Candidatus Latescibacterota bacterium]